MPLIDSHAHLTSDAVYPNIEEILTRAKEAGIEAIINICTDKITMERGLVLREKHPSIFNVGATTPHDAAKEGKELFPFFDAYARQGKLVAIGETGLDYYYYRETQERQKEIFRKYLHLALECKLPIVIHCRDAFDDFFEIIDADYRHNGKWGPGVLHCFTGSLRDAEKLIERGWFISFSGIVTYPKSGELREVAKMVPLEQMFIETDTPYLAPQTKRGKTNEPALLLETATYLAQLIQLNLEELTQMISSNIKQFFHI